MKDTDGVLQWAGSCYGVDLQGDDAVVVRAARSRGRVTTVRIPSDDPAFREKIGRGAACVGCLSSRESFARWVEVPLPASKKARKVLPSVLDIELPFSLETCVYEFFGIEQTARGTTRALAVVARLADVEKKVEACRRAGIDPVVLDQEGLAIWTQGLHEAPLSSAGGPGVTRVIVYLGGDRTCVAIGHGEAFVSAHGLGRADGVSLIRLLKTCQLPDTVQWAWAGPGAADGEAVGALHAELARHWPGPSFVHPEPEAFLARAVATRALLAGPWRCNLRLGPAQHPRIERRQRSQSVKAALLFLTAGLLLVGVNLAWSRAVRAREARIDQAFDALRDRLLGYRLPVKGEKAIAAVRLKLEQDWQRLAPFVDAFGPSRRETLIGVMDIGSRRGLTYDTVSLAPGSVLISGLAPDWKSGEELAAYLRQAGFRVALGRKEALANEKIPFTVSTGEAHD